MAKKQEKPMVLERIEPSAIEVSVARNGFLKPYITCFQYRPDNIAREPLGMFVGVLSINNRNEHSAYIVNFLASLAKKEYYGNPRRAAIENFESSLHKINLGLSELVKQGNTEWIGTLDAAICAIERNNLHFSVAGNAKVLLLRDKHIIDVSEGLSEESDNTHPMKTFTDVASGKIKHGDRVIITTPDLFDIIPLSDLERAGNRFIEEATFEQFLKTAITNSLDRCATIAINIRTVEDRRKEIAPRKSLATTNFVPNVWGGSVFEKSRKEKTSVQEALNEKKVIIEKDRIDNKTGHIYVTGDIPNEESSEAWERFQIIFNERGRSFLRAMKTVGIWIISKTKNLIREAGHNATGASFVILDILKNWKQKQALKKSLKQEQAQVVTVESIPTDIIQKHSLWKKRVIIISQRTKRVFQHIPRPNFLKRKDMQ